MSQLRIVALPAPGQNPDDACLDAFQKELAYIYRTLRRLGSASSDLNDLVQEVFIALHRSWPEYDPSRPLRPYLFGIAFRISAAYQRKYGREVAHGVVEVGDARPGPEGALESKQARALVLAALERIPLLRRAVLVMHDIDDVPVAQVAAELGIPMFTVYSRLRKARSEFQDAVRWLINNGHVR